MIKATARGRDGRKTLILGFSHANLDKLREDGLNGYVKIDGAQVGIDCDVIITCGPTEQIMAETFSQSIGPETKVHIAERLKQ